MEKDKVQHLLISLYGLELCTALGLWQKSPNISFIQNWHKCMEETQITHAYDVETKEELELVEKMGIDTVFIIKFTEEFKKLSPKDFIDKYLDEIICAKYVVCGFNFRFGHNREGNPEVLKALGKDIFELTVVDRVFIEDKTVSR